MPSHRPTRRALLASGAALLAGCQAPGGPGSDTPTDSATPTTTASSTSTGTTEPPASAETPPHPDRSWPMFNHDAANTGSSPESPGPGGTPSGDWRADVQGQLTLNQPAVVGRTAIIGSKRSVYAMDLVTGRIRWEQTVEQYAHHFTPAVVDDRVVVADRGITAGVQGGEEPGSIWAFDLTDGSEHWRDRAHPTASPAVADGTVYLANTADGTAYALAVDASSGEERWQRSLPCPDGEAASLATPAVVGDTAYFGLSCKPDGGSNRGALVALDAASGERRWRVELPSPVEAAPIVADGRVFAAGFDGTVDARDSSDGSRVWRTDTPGPVYTAPSIAGEGLFVLTDGGVERLGRADGSRDWRHELENVNISGIAVGRSTLYVGGNPLVALATDTGDRQWGLEVEGAAGAWGAPAVVGESIYAGSCIKDRMDSLYDNYLYALR